MIFPLITEKDIVIREPDPAEHERTAGYRRMIAIFHRAEEVHISAREENSVRFNLADYAKVRLKTAILRRLYPHEINQAIWEIRRDFCGNPSMPHSIARELNARLTELSVALTPEVK